MSSKISYSKGIYDAYYYLLENHKDFFVIGQGLWSPGMLVNYERFR